LSQTKLVIAIDGPAASGKSTTARLVARRLGYLYVDTGAMYRAVTLAVLNAGLPPDDAERISELVLTTEVGLAVDGDQLKVLLNGRDVSSEIRHPDVTGAVSAVSMIRAVRQTMVREQRRLGMKKGVVIEGRDIGTVVFPDADVKIFMVAGIEARARRRQRELAERGITTQLAQLVDEIRKRDEADSLRDESPLTKANDAIVLDTTELSIEEQVGFVVRAAEEKLKQLKEA
jgi:cytidylate kinase